MVKFFYSILIATAVAFGSDTLLLAQYTQKNDAKQLTNIIRNNIGFAYPNIIIKIIHKGNNYNVVIENIKNQNQKNKILAQLQALFNLSNKPESNNHSALSGILILDTGINSNIYRHTSIPTTDYGSFVLDNNTTQASDIFHLEFASLNWSHKISNSNINWNILGMLYSKNYLMHHDADITRLQIGAGPSLQLDNGEIGLLGSFGKLIYGGTGLLDIYRFDVPFSYKISDTKQIRLKASAIGKRYTTTYSNMNSNRLEISGSLAYTINKNLNQNIDFLYTKERKVGGTLTNISYDAFGVAWSIKYRMDLDNDIKFYVGLEHKNYIEKALGAAYRADNRWTVGAKILHHINKDLDVVFAYDGVDNISTLAAYTYMSHTLSLKLQKTF